MAVKKLRLVIVCTEHRGVFFGYAGDTSGDTIKLMRAKMAIYWGTTKGVGYGNGNGSGYGYDEV